MFASTPLKNVNDHIAEVHQDPVTGFGSLEAVQVMAFFRKNFVHVIHDGQHLTFRFGRTDNEEVRHP